jgi:pilus assembly protein Flp/PilA
MTKLQALCANGAGSIRRFAKDQSGATAIEYALIAVGIAVVIVAAVSSIGGAVKASFIKASNGFN